jgi:hypothetical protein
VFAISVPGLALVIVLGLVAVGAIAWLLSSRELSIDLRTFDSSDGESGPR